MTVHSFSGLYRPCPECHRPSAVLVNGVIEIAPGGTTLEWADDRATQWVTPHNEGCTIAARPNHPEGKWVTFPPDVLKNPSITVNGVKLGGEPE